MVPAFPKLEAFGPDDTFSVLVGEEITEILAEACPKRGFLQKI